MPPSCGRVPRGSGWNNQKTPRSSATSGEGTTSKKVFIKVAGRLCQLPV